LEIFRLFGSIFVNNDEANASLSKTSKEAEKTGSVFGKMGGMASGAASVVGKVFAAMGAAAVGAAAAIGGIALATANTGARIDKMSQSLGISRKSGTTSCSRMGKTSSS
jgi:lysozyme family protein